MKTINTEEPAKGSTNQQNNDPIPVFRNGVNVTQLEQTIEAVKEQPELADFKFRARNQWIDGSRNRASAASFYGTQQELTREKPFEFVCDEPPVLGGTDLGANPVEYVLAGLSGCMTTTLAFHTAARGIELESVESELEGDIDLQGLLDLDPNVRSGYREIRVKFKVKGDATEEEIEELVKMSPVYDTLTQPVPIKVVIEKV